MIIILMIAAGVMIALYGVWSVLAVFSGYFIGLFGWAQIIGSIRYRRVRGSKITFITIFVWAVILGCAFAAVWILINKMFVPYIVGSAVSLVHILFQKEIN